MIKKTCILLATSLAFAFIQPIATAAVKPGTVCKTVGQTSTSSGIKYTCVKSGKKLMWNKGVTVKGIPAPSQKVENKSLLAIDSRITPTSALTKLDTCKTEDITPYFVEDGIKAAGNGFPRPAFTVSGKKSAKVLVVPMSFKDLPFLDEKVKRGQTLTSDLDELNRVVPAVIDSYKKLSSQRFALTIDVLPKSQWWFINENNPFSRIFGVPNGPALSEIIDQYKKDFNFAGYDSVVFITGYGTPRQGDTGSAQAARVKSKNSKSGYVEAVLMIGSANQSSWWVHELGHTLFALEDLYPFKKAESGAWWDTTDGIGKWDLMADANKSILINWNRFLMGWLYDSEVRCIAEQKSSVHYLSNVSSDTNSKLLTINLSTGATLAAEAKTGSLASVVDGSRLLLYTINSYKEQGDEPITAQSLLISKGQSTSLLGWTFNVLDSDSDGLLVEVIKTDIDKFVPPAVKPIPNNPGAKISPIKVTKGEIISTGYLKARATWEVTGHQSYRVYVIAADDVQKVFFESRVLNGSQNPIVVEIFGLPCNRELRTITMFFSEKDGKGERLVMESKQLGMLACEDTTKKP